MTAHSTDISVYACLSELPHLMRLLVAEAQRLGIAEASSLRLQLIAEELFTNTVTHGFGRDSDTVVTLSLTLIPEGFRLRYADCAPPCDPTALPEQFASAETAGGLGVTLIRGMSRAFRYQRRDGQNVCEIEL